MGTCRRLPQVDCFVERNTNCVRSTPVEQIQVVVLEHLGRVENVHRRASNRSILLRRRRRKRRNGRDCEQRRRRRRRLFRQRSDTPTASQRQDSALRIDAKQLCAHRFFVPANEKKKNGQEVDGLIMVKSVNKHAKRSESKTAETSEETRTARRRNFRTAMLFCLEIEEKPTQIYTYLFFSRRRIERCV
jgi:hypothetical protein